jgi:4-alpha-glucanotransferase
MVLEAAGATRLIGEDLGTVPEYVRPNLTALGIAGFKIPIWETSPHSGELIPGADYARLSLATYGTHDHEPLRALWRRWQASPAEHHAELYRLARFAGIPADDVAGGFTPAVHARLMEALFACNSWIAVSMITDLFAREERFNVPGTSADSNWSQRMDVTVETMAQDPAYRAQSAAIRTLLEHSGRWLPPLVAPDAPARSLA